MRRGWSRTRGVDQAWPWNAENFNFFRFEEEIPEIYGGQIFFPRRIFFSALEERRSRNNSRKEEEDRFNDDEKKKKENLIEYIHTIMYM